MTASDMDKVCKAGLHPRNRFNTRYDFPQLIACSPALGAFVKPNAHGDDSIDYTDPQAHQCFRGIIGRGERFDLTMCNPPFHASMAEAVAGTQRKLPISACSTRG